MKFYIYFKNYDHKDIIDTPIGEVGLDMIDMIREELKDKKIPIDLICPEII